MASLVSDNFLDGKSAFLRFQLLKLVWRGLAQGNKSEIITALQRKAQSRRVHVSALSNDDDLFWRRAVDFAERFFESCFITPKNLLSNEDGGWGGRKSFQSCSGLERFHMILKCLELKSHLETKHKMLVPDQPLLCPMIEDRIYFSCMEACEIYDELKFCFFNTHDVLMYNPYCDDFGPLDLSCVMRFIEIIHAKLEEHPYQKLVYCAENVEREMTNAAFLMGSYLILVEHESPECVMNKFRSSFNFCNFRDATFVPDNFGLTLLDCWMGLACAQSLGWVGKLPQDGMYDMDEYDHYNSIQNGELNIVVPHKFVAFRGPRTLATGELYQDSGHSRIFSAHYYTDIFEEMGVSTVIRLNEPEYDPSVFTAAGLHHYDLQFEDCTPPPQDIVARFLRIVDAAPGMIAVHCKAGLGRTGTLIAVYLMLAHRFTAREAIGWLRIARPGSVIGDQQHYLAQIEARFSRAASSARPAGSSSPLASSASLSPSPAPTPTSCSGGDAAASAASGDAAERSRQVEAALGRRAAPAVPASVYSSTC